MPSMSKLTICKRFHFDAAHHLPNYKGKCHNPHGHRWYLEVELSGDTISFGPKTGMILDFSDLKNIVESAVLNWYDHSDINERIDNPTAENMVIIFVKHLQQEIKLRTNEVILEELRLYETDDSFVRWRR